MGDIAISNGVRSNLMALQNVSKMMDQTQNRLSTGNRVNSALDNPANFFTASAMNNRASDLGNLMDSMKTGVNTIKAADAALTSITKLVESAQGTARQALQDASTQKAASAEGDVVLGVATNDESAKTVAENKTLVGDLGLTAGDITLSSENNGVTTSDTFTIDASTTLDDLVNDINDKLGSSMTAAVTEDGKLNIKASDGGDLSLKEATAGDLQKLLGTAVAADATAGDTIAKPTSATNETRKSLASQFDDILDQITALAKDAEYNGVNLLQEDNLKVVFNEKTGTKQNSLTIKGVDLDSQGLGLTKVSSNFQSDAEIESRLDQMTKALGTLRTQASQFGSNLATVQTRQDFTTSMMNALEQGASDLTLADTNKEGANMLALQTRQQLAGKTMGMAAQADKAVLSFLR